MTNSSVTFWNFLEFACGVWGVCVCVCVCACVCVCVWMFSVRSRVNRECGTRRQRRRMQCWAVLACPPVQQTLALADTVVKWDSWGKTETFHSILGLEENFVNILLHFLLCQTTSWQSKLSSGCSSQRKEARFSPNLGFLPPVGECLDVGWPQKTSVYHACSIFWVWLSKTFALSSALLCFHSSSEACMTKRISPSLLGASTSWILDWSFLWKMDTIFLWMKRDATA